MGSYDNIVKIEEMRKRMEEGNIQAAQSILDTMEIKKIKNMSDLSLIAEVYAQNERYEEAEKLFHKIYEKTRSRRSLYQLLDISIKNNNIEEAQHYLEEYKKIAPKDFYKYIFQYKIEKLKGEPYMVLIGTLQTLKQTEYLEKWAYELAKTYYKAGMDQECIKECSDIILWFGEGVYVEKAKILRSYFSGEINKEKIMEELRRRSMEDTAKTPVIIESPAADGDKAIIEKDQTEDSMQMEEYPEADLSIQEETVDFEEGLKDDIRTIMTEGRGEDEETYEADADEEITNQENIQEENIEEENIEAESIEAENIEAENIEDESIEAENIEAESIEEEHIEEEHIEEEHIEEEHIVKEEIRGYEEGLSGQNGETESAPVKSEREIAEQEVEHALYHLLEEEEMDEDDKKLRAMAEQYGFLPEEPFGNFLHVKAVKKQLVKSLEGILDEHTKTVQIIITGTAGSGKTVLAKDITMFLFKTGKLKSSKIAKIKAEKLNTLELMSKKDTLKDCCLVVENASELKRQTIDSILELCNSLKENIAVIFEEDKKNINKLFRECPRLMDLFKNRIHLPQYTQEDLTGFAYACLRQQDYRMNPKAEKILQQKIVQIMKQPETQTHLERISALMQEVMNAADIRGSKNLSVLASQGKLQEADILMVLPEDFRIKP
jgi:adenylate kinase family enzyme